MKNIFSCKLYIQALKKSKLLGIACSAVTIVISMLFPIIKILDELESKRSNPAEFRRIYDQATIMADGSLSPMLILLVIFTPFFFYSMFSFLNKRNESDFYHAIPFKRTAVVVSFSAAIYTWLWGTALVSLLVNALLWSFCETVSFSFLLIPKLFGVICFATLYFGAFTLTAITLTGTQVSSSMLTLILFCLFRIVTLFFTSIIEINFDYIDLTKSYLSIFSTKYWFPLAFLRGFYSDMAGFESAPLWIWSSVVVIAFFALGIHFYRTRKSETASKSAPSKRLQHLYRCAFALPLALLTVFMAFIEDEFSFILIFLVLTLLAYYLYELITTKSIKSMLKSTPYLLVLAVVCAVFIGAEFASFAVFRNESTAVEDIKEVGFYEKRSELFDIEDRYYSLSFEELMTNELTISSDEARKIVSDAWTRVKENSRNSIFDKFDSKNVSRNVLIKRPSGRVIGRYLNFTKEEYEKLESLLLNSPEYAKAYLEIPNEKDFHGSSVYCNAESLNYSNFTVDKEIWKTFVSEYNALSDEDKIKFKANCLGESSIFRIFGYGILHSESFEFDYAIPDTFVKTLEKLKPLFDYELDEQYKLIMSSIDQIKNVNFQSGEFEFNIEGYLLTDSEQVIPMNGYFSSNDENEDTRNNCDKILAFLKKHVATLDEYRKEKCGKITLWINQYTSDFFCDLQIPVSVVSYGDAINFQKMCNSNKALEAEVEIATILEHMYSFLEAGTENCELNANFKSYYEYENESPFEMDQYLHYDGAYQQELETLENAFEWVSSHIVSPIDYQYGFYQTISLSLFNYTKGTEEHLEIPVDANIPREDFEEFIKSFFKTEYSSQHEE